MAILSKRWLEASVALSSVSEYANSGEVDRPIRASVGLTRHVADEGGIDALGLLVPLCASRLLSLGRRDPSIVPSLMEIVSASAIELAELGDNPAAFRVREIVDSVDPLILALPIVDREPTAPTERETRLVLAKRRGRGAWWGEFKIPRSSANPVVTGTALFAVLEYVARYASYERALRPTITGLAALYAAWVERGSPLGVSVGDSVEIDSEILAAILGKRTEGRHTTAIKVQPVALDAETWTKEASLVATRKYEPAAETALQVGTLKILGLDSFDELGGDTPSVVVGNARFGYALRNWECSQVFGERPRPPDDELARHLDDWDTILPASSRPVWVPRPIVEIVTEGKHGGLDAMLDSIEGVSGDQRREVFSAWGQYWPSDDRFTGRAATERLTAFGYLLHHAYDLRPDLLD